MKRSELNFIFIHRPVSVFFLRFHKNNRHCNVLIQSNIVPCQQSPSCVYQQKDKQNQLTPAQPLHAHHSLFFYSFFHVDPLAVAATRHHHHRHCKKKRHKKRKILVHDLDDQSVKVSTASDPSPIFHRLALLGKPLGGPITLTSFFVPFVPRSSSVGLDQRTRFFHHARPKVSLRRLVLRTVLSASRGAVLVEEGGWVEMSTAIGPKRTS